MVKVAVKWYGSILIAEEHDADFSAYVMELMDVTT
jgi:hypothetical protein